MRALLATLAVVLILGALFSGGEPAPEIESTGASCREEGCWCIGLRKPRRPGPGGAAAASANLVGVPPTTE